MAEREVETFRSAGIQSWGEDESEDKELAISLTPSLGSNVYPTHVHSRVEIICYARLMDSKGDIWPDYWQEAYQSLMTWGLIVGDAEESPGDLTPYTRSDDWLGTGMMYPSPQMSQWITDADGEDDEGRWVSIPLFYWFSGPINLRGMRRFDMGTVNRLWLHIAVSPISDVSQPDPRFHVNWESYSVWKKSE